MEKTLYDLLDDLDVAEMERLLDKDIDMNIDDETLKRIKSSVYAKAGIKSRNKRQKHFFMPKRLIAVAAAFVLVISSFLVVGFDNIAMAINHLFSFIPGYGIIENNDSILYVLSEVNISENDNVKMTLNNAIAGKDSITVMVTLERINYTEDQALLDKLAEAERMEDDIAPFRPKASLYAKGSKYTEYSGMTSGGGGIDTSTFTFELPEEAIEVNTTYVLAYEDYGLQLEFELKSYSTYNALTEIGPTESKNDISITAVPTFKDGQVEVNLYPINKSSYFIDSFFADGEGYLGNNLHLETNSGIKSYNPIDGHGSAYGKFMFEIDPNDRDFTLKIPFIVVQSVESQNIALDIPKEGEKVKTDYKIEFKDCTITITELERTSENLGDYGELKMTLEYDNKSSNKVMMNSDLYRTNFWGQIKGGGYSGEVDKNGIITTIYFALEAGENSLLRLKFANPVYYLTDEYSLTFKR